MPETSEFKFVYLLCLSVLLEQTVCVTQTVFFIDLIDFKVVSL